MARKRGLKNRLGEKVSVQFHMDRELHIRLWSVVYDTTGFMEQAIKEKLDREYNELWAQQQEILLRASL